MLRNFCILVLVATLCHFHATAEPEGSSTSQDTLLGSHKPTVEFAGIPDVSLGYYGAFVFIFLIQCFMFDLPAGSFLLLVASRFIADLMWKVDDLFEPTHMIFVMLAPFVVLSLMRKAPWVASGLVVVLAPFSRLLFSTAPLDDELKTKLQELGEKFYDILTAQSQEWLNKLVYKEPLAWGVVFGLVVTAPPAKELLLRMLGSSGGRVRMEKIGDDDSEHEPIQSTHSMTTRKNRKTVERYSDRQYALAITPTKAPRKSAADTPTKEIGANSSKGAAQGKAKSGSTPKKSSVISSGKRAATPKKTPSKRDASVPPTGSTPSKRVRK